MSTTNLNELDPESPDYEAAVEAAQRAEDEAIGNTEQPAGDQPAGDAAADDAQGNGDGAAAEPQADAAASAPAAAAADTAAAKPAGVMGKDGKTVLPYGALKGAREEARRERQGREAAEARTRELEQQIADLKAGKTPAAEGDAMSDEQEAELIADFPALKPVFERQRAMAAELAELKKGRPADKGADKGAENESDPQAELQEAIDSVPLLADWQSSAEHADKWARAQAIDVALSGSRKWAGKPLPERLAKVAEMVAEEFDIPLPKAGGQDDTQPERDTKPAGTRKPPAKAIEEAGRTAPNTLSDFKGGAADPSREGLDRLPPQRLLARFDDMDDDAIEAALRKSGGG